MIDLHLHTTASDGCLSAEQLVARAVAAGIETIAVTDHDTMASVPQAAARAAECGMTFVPGIEITAVDDGHDVHVLGYYVAPDSPELASLLQNLRGSRLARAREITERLAKAGAPIDADMLFETAGSGTIARPQIAKALIAARHVESVAEAFEKFLAEGRPAYVPHQGARPERVVEVIVRSGGVASLAHPGPLKRDHLIPALVESGLGALEVYHSDHDETARRHYLRAARDFDLLVTGGSDFHGNGRARDAFFGRIGLPPDDFVRLANSRSHAA